MKKEIKSGFVLFLLLIFSLPAVSGAEIIVPDKVAVAEKPVMLGAETRKGFFKKGGTLVEFFLDGKSIGKNLSGGDGMAYREIIPGHEGIKKVAVASGKERGEGLLLVLRKGREIIFIDVEGSLKSGQFEQKPKEESKEAVDAIAKRFPVIYLHTGFFGSDVTKEWLRENGFIESPLLQWQSGSVFEEIKGMGLKIKAVIGESAVLISAEELESRKFTFDEDVEDAETVEDWGEIVDKLK